MHDYRHFGIDTAMHYPLSIDGDQTKMRIFAATQYINDLVNNKNLKVYLHCTSGVIRSSTVALAYLCLYKRIHSWHNIHATRNFIVECNSSSLPNTYLVEQIVNDNYEFQSKQTDINSLKDMKRKEIIMKYDQKAKILKELALEKEQRNLIELERQRFLNNRRVENANNERRLDQESKARMAKYKSEIDYIIDQRQQRIKNEQVRLFGLDNKIESAQKRHKAEIKQQTEDFLADYRYKKQVLQRELMDAKQLRDRNQAELNQTKEDLRLQREEHARKIKQMEAEQARLKQALIELER